MKYDPAKHHRRSIRLKDFDYTFAGAYFVTICTKGRECVLDDPTVTGIILDVWHALPRWFPTIELDEFVVMPNHVHLVVWLLPSDSGDDVGATLAVAPDADRAGASPAPTDTDGYVGASLADAHDADAYDADVQDADRAGASPAPTEWVIPEPDKENLNPSLGDVIGAFKSLVFTVYLDWIEAHDPTRRAKFWQRNYHEHIIRSDLELNAIRRYIQENPLSWNEDRDNPDNTRKLPPPTKVEEYLEDIHASMPE